MLNLLLIIVLNFLTGAVVNDAVNNPKSLNYVIVGLAGLVIALVGYTLFKRR